MRSVTSSASIVPLRKQSSHASVTLPVFASSNVTWDRHPGLT
ncbi:MAG: hypothetical protein JWN72_628 [Thermoleophilia bacterium]|nr:hypothetical protein [Thermoleophilia bacterium]